MRKLLLLAVLVLGLPVVATSQQPNQSHNGFDRSDSVDMAAALSLVDVDTTGGRATTDRWARYAFWTGYVTSTADGGVGSNGIACAMLQNNSAAAHPTGNGARFMAKFTFEITGNPTIGEEVKVVNKYIADNPTTLHELPVISITNAFIKAYPCVVTK